METDVETESVDAGEAADLHSDEAEGSSGKEKEGDGSEAVEETDDG